MKAKEYAARYMDPEASNKSFLLQKIAGEFIDDALVLVKARGGSPTATLAVINEVELKWKSFARKVREMGGGDAVKESGFRDMFRFKLPEVYGKAKQSVNKERQK